MTSPALGGTVAHRLRIQYASTIAYPDGAPPAWVATATYTAGQVVTTNGTQSWWLCIATSTNHTPPNGTYWQAVSANSLYATQLLFTSLPGSGLPYIAEAPQGDGSQINTLTGEPTIGSYRYLVIDAPPTVPSGSSPGLITPTGIITQAIADSTGNNTLLARRAYGELSRDGGTTWQTVVAGYVTRLQLVDAATYEWSVGETRRVEQSAQIFQTIVPGLAMGTCIMGGPIANEIAPGTVVQKPPIQTPISITDPVPLTLYDPAKTVPAGTVVQKGAFTYLATATSTGAEPSTSPASWTPVNTAKVTTAPAYNGSTVYGAGMIATAADGNMYLARVSNAGVEPVADTTSTWLLLAPPTTAPKNSNNTVPAPQWLPFTTYLPGVCVTELGIIYVCVQANGPGYTATVPPPNTLYWSPVPAGMTPIGVWVPTTTYYPGQVVVAADGNLYLNTVQSFGATQGGGEPPGGGLNPVVDIENTYWIPVSDLPFPAWSNIPDYGGAMCTVIAVGEKTPLLRVVINNGWFKTPTPKAGQAPWTLCGVDPGTGLPVALPAWAIDYMNAPIPSLCAAYGPAPMSYAATFLRGLTPYTGWPPTNIASYIRPDQGGVVDTFVGDSSSTDLGWVIGGLALQITLPSGQEVTVNAYPIYGSPSVVQNSVSIQPQFVNQYPLTLSASLHGTRVLCGLARLLRARHRSERQYRCADASRRGWGGGADARARDATRGQGGRRPDLGSVPAPRRDAPGRPHDHGVEQPAHPVRRRQPGDDPAGHGIQPAVRRSHHGEHDGRRSVQQRDRRPVWALAPRE